MGSIGIWQLLILLIVVFPVIPLLLTAFSKRANGAQKVGWVILIVFTSWIGYAIFLIVTSFMNTQSQQQT